MIFINTQFKKIVSYIIFPLVLLSLVTAACAPQTPVPTETATATPTTPPPTPTSLTTPRPTATPTLPPLGAEGNPITIGFILTPEDTAGSQAAEDIAFLIEQDTGYQVESTLYPDFQSLSTAVLNGDVDLFWLKPLEYIYLNWEGAAQVMLLTNHLGVYAYGIRFFANVNRGFTPYFDLETNLSAGDPVAALQQFSGTRPCFIEPLSLPGYLLPMGLLSNTSTPVLDPVFVYNYEAVIRALYIQGICDFGVSYALTGDARTASSILQDIPTAQQDVIVIWQSEGIIPNINLSASTALSLAFQVEMREALLDLPNTPEGLNLLSTALNYDVEALQAFDDSFYNPLRAAIIPLALNLQELTQLGSDQ